MVTNKKTAKSVKKAAQNKTTIKKAAVKTTEKKVAKKTVESPEKVVKKATPEKKIVEKTTKKVVVKKTAVQKSTTKKVVKKAVKKVSIPKEVNQVSLTEKNIKIKAIEVEQPFIEKQGDSLVQPLISSDTQQYWQENYNEERLVLLIRDPYWCFAYWDVSPGLQQTIIQTVQTNQAKLVLRIYDVTDVSFDGTNAHRFMDIEISEEATNWYVNVWEPGRAYCVDLGFLYSDGLFKTLLRSNVVTTPRDSISPIVDEEWMVVDEMFDQLYQSAGGGDVGRSSEAITKYMLKRVRADVTSGGLASMGSDGGRPKSVNSEDFWLVVHTELIVYGATEPNAKLTIQGQPMPLNNDGTFSVRYALSDGKQIIGVKARNESGTQERTITPIVEKRTE